MTKLVPKPDNLAALVFAIRGEKVLLDADLAELYGVEAKVLNQAVKRNLDRFPEISCFQLTTEEWKRMRSQSVTASRKKVHPKALIDELLCESKEREHEQGLIAVKVINHLGDEVMKVFRVGR